jgi:ABC-type Zn uptake system ZnuABC Zn-binding protein ZnuA/ABC-type Mn2+/Zn2+ transport system permease subunit
VFEPFHYAFVQRGLLEVLLLSIPAGILGTWIVLRGLAFFSHAVGTAAFPGLVVAAGLGWPAPAGAALAATAYTFGVEGLASRRESDRETLTGLTLVGALALGVILASDVFHSGANVETLLFGSLLLVGSHDVRLAAIAAALSLALTVILGRHWLATGFERQTARSLGVRAALLDTVLLAAVAFAVVAALSAIGALLAAALYVVPAATTRLWFRRLATWQAASVALAAAEGVVGLWLSVELNVPPGAAIAVLAGGVFAAAALGPQLLALLAVLVLAGCGAGSGGSGLRVVATTTQIADWTRAVGGADVTVHQILRPNTDPHEYEPRPRDVEATAGAKVVFENGDELDHWMAKVVEQAGGKPRVVVLGERVPVRRPGESSGPEASRFDPHWWHDPRNAEAAVRAIRDAVSTADPSHRAAYARRAAAYLRRLRALDTRLAACFARLPRTERKLVTDHDAFGYFAHRYGLDVVGAVIPSQTTQAQPSAGATARLIRLIRREHVRAVFPESSLNRRLAETIARETGAVSSYTLYGDTLGPAGSAGATYLGMEQANADAIVRGLSGGRLRCR